MNLNLEFMDDDYSSLCCPVCGGAYLHHEKVEVFEREEDAGIGLHVLVIGQRIVTDTSIVGNPSSRRHGLKIEFSCELCPNRSVLTIAQHKGHTHIEISPIK